MSRFAFSVFFFFSSKIQTNAYHLLVSMELCVRTPREATRVHATTAGQAKTATKVLYNYILYNLVYNFIFLLSMSLNEKLFCTGKEENNVLLFFFLFLISRCIMFLRNIGKYLNRRSVSQLNIRTCILFFIIKTSMNVKSNSLVPMMDSVQTLKGRLNVRAPLDGQGSTAPTVIKIKQIGICLHA